MFHSHHTQESQLMLKQQRMKIENLLEHGAKTTEQDEV